MSDALVQALAHAAALPPACVKAADGAVFLAVIRPAMDALRPVLADGAQVDPDAATRLRLQALLALHGLLPADGRLAAAPYGQAPLPPEALRLPAPADRHHAARRLAVWRSAHRALTQIARRARAQAARTGPKGSESAQAQALLARLRWAIAALEARRRFVTKTS
jgi:hypothetical protein